MQKENVTLPALTLVGITARTNNKNEMNPDTSKIGGLFSFYQENAIADIIKHRAHPGITYSVYTEFESDEQGDYTYFLGEVVSSTDDQDTSQLSTLTIPSSHYQKFTTAPGEMPGVVISAWQAIWAMSPDEMGGERSYIADFEVYDQRASDPSRAIVDIYVGIK